MRTMGRHRHSPEQVIRKLAEGEQLLGEGEELSVSVNISASNLPDPGFPEPVQSLLKRHGLPAEALLGEV